jgi:O-antigen/teichoic acid export membrane protein
MLTSRSLGPEAFGLLAAFMAIVGIASTGSSALQNSVAVGSASSLHKESPVHRSRSKFNWDPSLTEAIVLGGIGSLAVAISAPWLAKSLNTGPEAVFLAAATILPAFLFSRSLGILQGSGKSKSVAGWTSGGQAFRLLLIVVIITLSLGAISMLFAVFLSTLIITIGSAIQASRTGITPAGVAFSKETITVLLLVLAFSWLTNIEIVLVRSGAPELESGSFAAAAVLTKTIFIVPGMMSVYLLPRFVSSKNDKTSANRGVIASVGLIFVGGAGAFVGLLLFSAPVTLLLFGKGYDLTVQYLPWMALAYLPWAMSQGLLIRLTAIASKSSLVIFLIAAVVQWVGALMLLPNIFGMIVLIGALGCAVFACLVLIHYLSLKADHPQGENAHA